MYNVMHIHCSYSSALQGSLEVKDLIVRQLATIVYGWNTLHCEYEFCNINSRATQTKETSKYGSNCMLLPFHSSCKMFDAELSRHYIQYTCTSIGYKLQPACPKLFSIEGTCTPTSTILGVQEIFWRYSCTLKDFC